MLWFVGLSECFFLNLVFSSSSADSRHKLAQKWRCDNTERLHANCWRVRITKPIADSVTRKLIYFVFSRHNLRILGLINSDAGMFQCVGSNPAGSVQAAARLRINEPGMTFNSILYFSFCSFFLFVF